MHSGSEDLDLQQSIPGPDRSKNYWVWQGAWVKKKKLWFFEPVEDGWHYGKDDVAYDPRYDLSLP